MPRPPPRSRVRVWRQSGVSVACVGAGQLRWAGLGSVSCGLPWLGSPLWPQSGGELAGAAFAQGVGLSLHTVFLPQRGWTGYFIPWRHYSKRARPEAQVFCPASAHFKCDSVPLAKAGRTASTRREAGLVGAVKMTVSRSRHAT